MAYNPITDCDGEGCGKCIFCQYLDFLEHARSAGVGTIERNDNIEAYLKAKGITP